MKLFDKYFYNIFIVISISIILRIYFINIYGDIFLEYEWKTLFGNLKDHGVLSYRSFNGEFIPSVYMPPLYAYYLYAISFIIFDSAQLVKAVIFSQIILSIISIFVFYKINLEFFDKKISIISSYIFSLVPINIYSCLQISSITIQIFLNIFYLYLVIKIIKKPFIKKNYVILGLVCGFSMLLRGEFILIFLSSLIFLFYFNKINLTKIFLILMISAIVISPYLTRNYLIFEKFTITKSFGYNLWKGNNIDSGVEGSESTKAFEHDNINIKINKIPKNKYYDFNYDKIFLDSSIKFIVQNPSLSIERYVKKFLTFIFFNFQSNYPNYNNPLNILPIALISVTSVISIFVSFKKDSIEYKYLIFNIFLTISIFSLFFILPRYKLIILPIQILIINFLITKYFSYKKKKQKGV